MERSAHSPSPTSSLQSPAESWRGQPSPPTPLSPESPASHPHKFQSENSSEPADRATAADLAHPSENPSPPSACPLTAAQCTASSMFRSRRHAYPPVASRPSSPPQPTPSGHP